MQGDSRKVENYEPTVAFLEELPLLLAAWS